MGVFGGLIFGALGWAIGGPIGGLIGALIGGLSNSSVSTSSKQGGYSSVEQRNSFMLSLLVLSVAVMRADGKVLRSELDYVKQFIRNNFGEEALPQALQIIKKLLGQEVDYVSVCAQIRAFMPASQRLQLFHYLAGIASADGVVSPEEIALLRQLASQLALGAEAEAVIAMYAPKFDPYQLLGITSNASDEEVKKAYKKMAMKFHPDKVEALGEDVRRAAEEKFKNIQEAYRQIKLQRGWE